MVKTKKPLDFTVGAQGMMAFQDEEKFRPGDRYRFFSELEILYRLLHDVALKKQRNKHISTAYLN